MKKTINTDPYAIFWWTIPIILLVPFFMKNAMLTVHWGERYIVIEWPIIIFSFALIHGFLGGVYWVARNMKLIKWMTILHMGISIFTTWAIIVMLDSFLQSSEPTLFEISNPLCQKIMMVMIIWMISQIVFMANLFIGLNRK